jgi:hypothetical protein
MLKKSRGWGSEYFGLMIAEIGNILKKLFLRQRRFFSAT